QDVEWQGPAGGDHQHGASVGQATMDERELHQVAARLELEGDVAALSRGDDKPPWWIELGDPALHAVLRAETGRALAGWLGELVVAPHQLEGRADRHLHLARGQPLAAQVALGEIGPDALDGT